MKSVFLLSGAVVALATVAALADPQQKTGEHDHSGNRTEQMDRPAHRGGAMHGMRGMTMGHGMHGMSMGHGEGRGHGMHGEMHARMHGDGGMHGPGAQYPRPSDPDRK